MRDPDFIIGPVDNPYLLRWYLWPRNRFCNLYLHKFLRSDDDRALHDHPWWFISILLCGSYSEVTNNGIIRRNRLSVAFRKAEHRHRVVLDKELTLNSQCLPLNLGVNFLSVWTLVLTGPRVREWGFWCPSGFVHWRDFTKGAKGEEIGKGCGE